MEIVYYFECLEMKKSNTGEQVKKKKKIGKRWVFDLLFFKTGSSNSISRDHLIAENKYKEGWKGTLILFAISSPTSF